MALPQVILDDITAIQTAATQFQTDNAALPGLAATAQTADAAYAAGQAAAQNDATAINTAVAKLTADLTAFEAGTLPTPPPAS